MPTLLSIQTGKPRTVGNPAAEDAFQRPFTSAIWKEPVAGQLWASREGLTGDQVVDARHHGGRHRALLMYSADHYPKWRAEWGRRDVGPGGFGENLTVSTLTESHVCVGDRYTLGEVEVEVTSPREPCGTLARRWGVRDLVDVIYANHRSGWYLRVLKEGWLEAGIPVRLVDRPYPQWTLTRAATVKLHRHKDRAEANLLAQCPALIPTWREKLVPVP
ncbi:MAG: MOSC domain-containing protein [Gemmatimonadota bacterium]